VSVGEKATELVRTACLRKWNYGEVNGTTTYSRQPLVPPTTTRKVIPNHNTKQTEANVIRRRRDVANSQNVPVFLVMPVCSLTHVTLL
jgi:hypothetical protein